VIHQEGVLLTLLVAERDIANNTAACYGGVMVVAIAGEIMASSNNLLSLK
jgi:hypothetical protein